MQAKVTALTAFTTLALMSASVEAGRYYLTMNQVAPNLQTGGSAEQNPFQIYKSAHDVHPKYSFDANAFGYRVKGYHTVELTWSGANSQRIDIYREGQLIITTKNSGAFVDSLNSKSKGVSYTYELCESDTQICSNHVTFSF